MNNNSTTFVINDLSKYTKYHELALEMAKLFIQENYDKSKLQSQFSIACSDFYVKYIEALKTFEAMDRK